MNFLKVNKVIKKYWILFITFVAVTIISLITLTSVIRQYEAINNRSNNYSKDAVMLTMSSGFKEITLKDLLDYFKEKHNGYLEFDLQGITQDQYKVCGLYKGDNYKYDLNLSSGKDISYLEYCNDEPVALIKDDAFNKMQEKGYIKNLDGMDYIDYCGVSYKVKGVIDSKKSNVKGDVVINVYSIVNNKNFESGLRGYMFIYDSNEETRKDIKELCEKYDGVSFEINDLYKGKDALQQSIKVNSIYICGTALLLVVCIMSVINISVYWIESEKREFAIRKLIGGKNTHLVLLLFKRYVGIALLAIVSGFISFQFIKKINAVKMVLRGDINISVEIVSLIALAIIMFLIVLLVLIKPIYQICRIEINTILREAG